MGSLQIKVNYSRGHQRFTLRCLSKDLIPVSVRPKSTINTRRAKQIIHKTERQLLKDKTERKLLKDRVQGINNILKNNTVRLDRCRSRLLSLVASTTMQKCTNFINKIRESRI